MFYLILFDLLNRLLHWHQLRSAVYHQVREPRAFRSRESKTVQMDVMHAISAMESESSSQLLLLLLSSWSLLLKHLGADLVHILNEIYISVFHGFVVLDMSIGNDQ